MKNSITTFLKITKKKLIITLLFPFTALLILFSGFILDEILGLGGNTIANAIYSLVNSLYLFIFLPLIFVDDLTPSIIMKSAIILTIAWWYFLSCALIFIRKNQKRKPSIAQLQQSQFYS
ncbi:MAG: hypothetical protein DRN71_02885 [Candidatus Nanohalarchaeota archaeon]|nr:MAG: hypothetical protein DRN71_02885 [Candidatus Nanohaloarchaeota archaeon]